MSEQLMPEVAQRITEESWNHKKDTDRGQCGWCDFTGEAMCHQKCPVFKITKEVCYSATKYIAWTRAINSSEKEKAATVILKWLVKHRDELIRIGHEILAESKQ